MRSGREVKPNALKDEVEGHLPAILEEARRTADDETLEDEEIR